MKSEISCGFINLNCQFFINVIIIYHSKFSISLQVLINSAEKSDYLIQITN